MQILLNPVIHSSGNYPRHCCHNSRGQSRIKVPDVVPRPWLPGPVVGSCFQPTDCQEAGTRMQRGQATLRASKALRFRVATCCRCTERQRKPLCGEGRMQQTDAAVRRQRPSPDR